MRLALAVALLLAAPRAEALTIFGLVDTGELWASADAGATWTNRSTLPVRDAVALAAGATSSELFLASASGSFYRSTDAGAGWTAVGAVPASDVAAMISGIGRLLLFTASGGVYASVDGGASFTPVGVITAGNVVGAARQASLDFALTRTGEVYRSADGGAGWTAVGTMPASDLVALRSFGNQLHALTSTGDVARSADQGASWSFVGTLSQVGVTSLTASSAELLATTRGGEIAASADAVAWSWRGAIGQLVVRALANDLPAATGVEPSPSRLALAPPWPNPGRDALRWSLTVAAPATARIELLDLAGRRAALLFEGPLEAGPASGAWTPAGLAAGVYHLRATVADETRTRRWVWLGSR